MSDAAKEGEELAKAWLAGKGELFDDLADLVESMSQPRDPVSRTFLKMIGNSAKASAGGKARPASARIEAQPAAQPSPEAPPAPLIDLNEMMRRRRERERARRLEEFGRRNQEAFMEQRAFMAGSQTPADGASGEGRREAVTLWRLPCRRAGHTLARSSAEISGRFRP